MHDPKTVAHEVKWPFKDKYGYRKTLLTVWHVDPESDRTDDSCGWFLRGRHLDQEKLSKIQKEFSLERQYWFPKERGGHQAFSTIAIVCMMYQRALWVHYDNKWNRVDKFMKRHLHSLILFAENPIDSLHGRITGKHGHDLWKDGEIEEMASIVYADICRKTRPWYKHPKWHIHHWKFQVHWPRLIKRNRIESAPCDDNLRATV